MKTIGLLLVLCLSLASRVGAQIPIHGSPQGISSYNSTQPTWIDYPDPTLGQWPAVSGQGHWLPGSGGVLDPPSSTLQQNLSHTHVECNVPVGGELNGPVTMPCRVVLYHTAGSISQIGGVQVTAWTWDDPTVTLPIAGDPTQILDFYCHITVDPTHIPSDRPSLVPAHGYWVTDAHAMTTFTDGTDSILTNLVMPFYSVVDPTQPEAPIGEDTTVLEAAIHAGSTLSQLNGFGESVVSSDWRNLPIFAPFNAPLTPAVSSYTYGVDPRFQSGTYEAILDADLHHAVPGTPLAVRNGGILATNVNYDSFDPTVIGASTAPMGFPAGVHRISLTWDQSTGPNGIPPDPTCQYGPDHCQGYASNQEVKSLLVIMVRIGTPPAGTPPPPPPPPPPPATCLTSVQDSSIGSAITGALSAVASPLEGTVQAALLATLQTFVCP